MPHVPCMIEGVQMSLAVRPMPQPVNMKPQYASRSLRQIACQLDSEQILVDIVATHPHHAECTVDNGRSAQECGLPEDAVHLHQQLHSTCRTNPVRASSWLSGGAQPQIRWAITVEATQMYTAEPD